MGCGASAPATSGPTKGGKAGSPRGFDGASDGVGARFPSPTPTPPPPTGSPFRDNFTTPARTPEKMGSTPVPSPASASASEQGTPEDTVSTINSKSGGLQSTVERAARLQERGRLDQAEALLQQALAEERRALLVDPRSLTEALDNLAALLQARGTLGEAEPMFREAVELRKAHLGADHRETAAALNNLAGVIHAGGRLDEAGPIYAEALAVYRRCSGASSPGGGGGPGHSPLEMVATLNNFSGLLQQQGKHGEAEPHLAEAAAIRRAAHGARSPEAGAAMHRHAGALWAAGRGGEAETLLREALGVRRERLGPVHVDVAASLHTLARLLAASLAEGSEGGARAGEAESLFTEALSILKAKLGADHPHTKACQSSLDALVGVGMFHAARRVCILVSVLPLDADGGGEGGGRDALRARVLSVALPDIALAWHESRQGIWQPEDEDEAVTEGPLSLDFTCSMEVSPAEEPAATELILEAVRGLDGVGEAQLLLSAPCLIPLRKHEVEHLVLDEGADVEGSVWPLLDEVGMAVWRGAVSGDSLARAREAARKRIAMADEAMDRRGLDREGGHFAFREISSRGRQRFDLLLDPEDPAAAPVFALGRGGGGWCAAVDAVLGPDATLAVSVVYSRPGADAQDWHSDGPHRGRLADWSGKGQDRPYALCVFVPLVDLGREVGFTQFWAGSHRHSGMVGLGPACPIIGGQLDAIAPAGSAIMYDYRLMHRGMPNTSEGTERPVLQFLYHQPDYHEVRNYGSESIFD